MKRFFAAIGCVVVAAAVLWLALRGDEGAPEPVRRPGAEEPPPGTSPPERETAQRERAAPPSEGESAPGADPARAAPTPPHSQPTPTTVAEADASGVLTVVGPDGTTPVPRAPVFFRSIEPSGEPVHLVTDAEGRVRLPRFEGTAGARVAHEGDRGVCLLDKRQSAWTLRLTRYVTLRAIVHDAEGTPVGGVPVALVHRLHGRARSAHEAKSRAGDGLAQVECPIGDDFDAGPHELALALPLADRTSARVDLPTPPKEPVVLVLPPTGRVVCSVQGAEGGPVSDGCFVVLRCARRTDEASELRRVLHEWNEIRAVVRAGRAEFPRVGLGLELEVVSDSRRDSRTTVARTFAGPREPGGEVIVSLTEGGPRPIVTGRLVEADGAPLAGVTVEAHVLDPGEPDDGIGEPAIGEDTDAAGRFRFSFDLPPDEVPGRRLRLDRAIRAEGERLSTTRLAVIDLPPRLPAGETDLGVVVVPARGVVAEGIVVDGDGKPLEGAAVRAFEIGARRRTKARDVDGAVTDAAGRFRLVGGIRGSEVGLGVDLDGWFVEEDRSFAPGTTGARVVLRRGGAIAGFVRVPETMSPQEMRIHVSGDAARNGSGDRWDDGIEDAVGRNGTFEFRSLRPGMARVEIRLAWDESDPIFVVEDVKVVAGGVTRDPRLADVDPAKLVRFAAVQALDPEGRPLAAAEVHFRPTGRAGATDVDRTCWKLVTTNADGRASVRFPRAASEDAALDIVVKHPGFRSAVLRGVRSDATATLARGRPTTVRLRLDPETPLPPAEFALFAFLEWSEPGADPGRSAGLDPRSAVRLFDAGFGTDRVLSVTVRDPGRYRVVLGVRDDLRRGGGALISTVPEPLYVTVGESGEPVEIVVGVDRAELERATESSK